MANICSYFMKVQGEKKNIQKFIKIIQQDDINKGKHFFRIFKSEIENKETIKEGYVIITGSCAWSVYSCMMEGPQTYYSNSNYENGTSLEKESENLNLIIEVYSEEPGIGFQEHILIINGEIKDKSCVSYREIFTEDYATVELLNEENQSDFSEEEFENNDCLCIGGYSNWEFQ